VPSFDTYNAAYVQALFDSYLQNPRSVDEAWRQYFAEHAAEFGLPGTPDGAGAPVAGPPSEARLIAARAAGELVDAYRLHGHRAARLDPLGSAPAGHPQLDPEFHGITEPELFDVPASLVGLADAGQSIGDVVAWLRTTYTGPVGYEFEYLEDPERREWLREQIESGAFRQPLSSSERLRLLERLTEVEAFEQFIHRAYLGSKRFSIEGTDMMVPMLDLAIERAAAGGARQIVLGMAHRGRLNVLAHVIGMPYGDLIEKFEGRHAVMAGTGDVKYHLGAQGTYATTSGEPLTVLLAPNPSHLEFVDPVVEGMTRAMQTRRDGRVAERDENVVVPVIIHGDAAFSGQGVVAETLNLARLAGYRTGGTIHIIANNQVGFTTDPRDARSTDYASDMARGFDVPIFHVNADEPEACLAVVRLALAFRARFHHDVVIDLVGYRRYGHNEGDEPAYTQPVMYAKVAHHAPVRALWAERLIQAGVTTREQVDGLLRVAHDRLVQEQERVRAAGHDYTHHPPRPEFPATLGTLVETAVPRERLLSFDRQLHTWPEGFSLNPKLARQLDKRGHVLPDGSIDWAHAESLALASLIADGIPVRMTGQDTERGTFSQRHLVLHDINTGATFTPLQNLAEARVPFEVFNSPLSELGAMGFEYGYSVMSPETLVLWEAQFGDFANAAQVIIDQFLAAGRAKWGQESRLVLLLPHGYEGQGPEHSSARLERFLQLCAENNMRVVNCSTPAQYFHMLRRQALLAEARPIVVMTPKSLLRHPRAVAQLSELEQGRFQRVMDDALVAQHAADVGRIVLCSGKIFYDLEAARNRDGAAHVALIRVEQFYPLRHEELERLFTAYAAAREIAWVQEEPENMGAWRWMEPHVRRLAGERGVRYIGRPERASPAEGYANDHETEQDRIVADALSPLAGTARKRSRQSADRAR
jgi:2-oxoglutarate dehydrogenase E1 component